jgi:hypothetical protein
MEFLDVSTQVSLGFTTKKNQEHLSEQVDRRKSRFQAIQNKISNELLSADIMMPSRGGAPGSKSSSRSLSID